MTEDLVLNRSLIDVYMSYNPRMSFLWKQRTQREKEQKKNLEEVNQLLLESILPTKVSKYYMEEENNAVSPQERGVGLLSSFLSWLFSPHTF